MKTVAIVILLIHLTFAQNDICQNQPDNTLLHNREECSLYFICIGNESFLSSCPEGMLFDRVMRRCDNAENVNCDDVTETPTPPGPQVNCDGVPNFRYVASPESCSNYYQCIDGNAFLMSCPLGLHFHVERQTCDDPSNVNCDLTSTPTMSPTPTPPGPSVSCDGVPNFRFISSPDECYLYYQCIDGTPFRLSCPMGLYFDLDRQTCDDPRNVECDLSTTPTVTPSPTPPPPPGRCDGVPNFRFIASQDACDFYYQCIDGTPFRLSCPMGLYFDLDRQTCDDPRNVVCDLSTTPIVSPTPTPQPPSPCDGIPNFRFIPSPDACDLYYQCIDGTPFRLSCPLGLYFDIDGQTCDDPRNVNCPLTPTPPTIPPPTVSCEGVPNLRFIPSPVSCSEYFQCVEGIPFRLACPRGFYFSEPIQTCDYSFNVDCQTFPTSPPPPPGPPSCEGVEDFRFIAHEEACHMFYQCITGNAYLLTCPIGLYFSEIIQTCDDPENVDCVSGGTTTVGTTTSPIVSPQCVGVPEGQLVANAYSCTSFYECIDGLAQPRFCEDGLWFDQALQGCDLPENVDCPASTIPTVPTIDPINICDGVPNESYVGSNTYCERFYFCINGEAYGNICQDGHWFDRERLVCDLIENVNCDLQTLPTTMPTTTSTIDPSPDALCRAAANNTFVRNYVTCSEFFLCINEEPHGRTCEEGLWFNLIQQRCTVPYEAGCELDSFLCNGVDDGQRVRSLTTCSDFILCTDGEPIPLHCYNNYWFNEESQECDDPANVDCDLVVPTEEPRSVCDGVRDFWLKRSDQDCSVFFVCINNEPGSPLTCPDEQFFDEELQACDDEADCDL